MTWKDAEISLRMHLKNFSPRRLKEAFIFELELVFLKFFLGLKQSENFVLV